MKLFNYREVELEGRLRWLIRGPHFDMRMGEIEPSKELSDTPHTHPWEHEVFIVEGSGSVWDGEKRHTFREGDVLYIPAGEPHTFMNQGEKTLRFICCIPAGVDLEQIKPVTQ